MPHKRAKNTVREQQRKERSALTLNPFLPLIFSEAQILRLLVPTALPSAPKASLNLSRACWTRQGFVLNIGRKSGRDCRKRTVV